MILGKSKCDLFLCPPHSLTVEKIIYFSFLFPWKFVESTYFLKQCNPIRDSSAQEDYFLPSVIWPSLNIKIFVKTNSKPKKYDNCFEEIVLVFNTGIGKYDCNNIV